MEAMEAMELHLPAVEDSVSVSDRRLFPLFPRLPFLSIRARLDLFAARALGVLRLLAEVLLKEHRGRGSLISVLPADVAVVAVVAAAHG